MLDVIGHGFDALQMFQLRWRGSAPPLVASQILLWSLVSQYLNDALGLIWDVLFAYVAPDYVRVLERVGRLGIERPELSYFSKKLLSHRHSSLGRSLDFL